ncbi:ATP-binding protein [Butyrivibrio sp. X503]|uniref:sensor histidine kinase n=1 Tax=Butyrivibrio sp. X503 TaxID=2364878 RepID=UPI000EA9AB92|nr:sensor histidine kinase [Butyrivibrio sp. X503]RKM55302.1 ATP-binding protein [Butyrivibrio sp. X503]
MDGLGLMLGINAFSALINFIVFWIILDKFFEFQKTKWRNSNWIWIMLYLIISLISAPANIILSWDQNDMAIRFTVYILTLGRLIPFFMAKYGFNLELLIIIPFYENLFDVISINLSLFINDSIVGLYDGSGGNVSRIVVGLTTLILFNVLIYKKHYSYFKAWFTKLTIKEYIIVFLLTFSCTYIEVVLVHKENTELILKVFSVASIVLMMILIPHINTVRNQNTSMNAMIGNLKGPMKQIAASYIEMHEKNTELRRFRHDTKNLLLALHSLIAERKYDQASEYISKMQETMEITKEKEYDTGNFIADALLEYKGKLATKKGITMTMEGCIPVNKVEDVNLVILISNLLDNAIEAAVRAKGEKKIEIQSILKKNIWILSVKNSCINDVVIRGNRIETTKNNKEAHGFGLSNIERVTQKYAGNLKISCENKMFTAIATLMLTV